jgi:hypothetical protein
MFTDGGMYTHAIAILEIDLGSQTGRNTVQSKHTRIDHLTSRVEVCKIYFPVYTCTCTPPPLPTGLSFLTKLNFGILTTSSGTISDNHVSVIMITSGLHWLIMTSSSSFLLRIDLAFSNKNFGKEPSRAAFVVFVIGILIKLWLLLCRMASRLEGILVVSEDPQVLYRFDFALVPCGKRVVILAGILCCCVSISGNLPMSTMLKLFVVRFLSWIWLISRGFNDSSGLVFLFIGILGWNLCCLSEALKLRLHNSHFGYGTLKFWHADPCFLVRLLRLHDEIFALKKLGSARLNWERHSLKRKVY